MSTILKRLLPVAKKEHRCMFCGCKIKVGEKYSRETLIYDGDLYDWVAHLDCIEVSNTLDMYDYADDDGLSAEEFDTYIADYLANSYTDEELEEHIYKMTRIEQVRMILNDIKSKSK